ncbi:MAG: hypothetical protein HYZ90_02440 [Candidatus Omnitrophica bacterium]|nr:hypothetical protein [Candidatus Omnitrophota bacterium]
MRHIGILGAVGVIAFVLSGCGSTMTTYTKPEAPWGTIQRVAVMPFTLPSDNPTRRQLVTQLFTEELRRIGMPEVVEVPLSGPTGGVPKFEEVATQYQVDAIFSGSVDDTQGTVVHVRLHDAATKEILWSGTYALGVGPEFFSLRTQQQQFQRSLQRLAGAISKERGGQ